MFFLRQCTVDSKKIEIPNNILAFETTASKSCHLCRNFVATCLVKFSHVKELQQFDLYYLDFLVFSLVIAIPVGKASEPLGTSSARGVKVILLFRTKIAQNLICRVALYFMCVVKRHGLRENQGINNLIKFL